VQQSAYYTLFHESEEQDSEFVLIRDEVATWVSKHSMQNNSAVKILGANIDRILLT